MRKMISSIALLSLSYLSYASFDEIYGAYLWKPVYWQDYRSAHVKVKNSNLENHIEIQICKISYENYRNPIDCESEVSALYEYDPEKENFLMIEGSEQSKNRSHSFKSILNHSFKRLTFSSDRNVYKLRFDGLSPEQSVTSHYFQTRSQNKTWQMDFDTDLSEANARYNEVINRDYETENTYSDLTDANNHWVNLSQNIHQMVDSDTRKIIIKKSFFSYDEIAYVKETKDFYIVKIQHDYRFSEDHFNYTVIRKSEVRDELKKEDILKLRNKEVMISSKEAEGLFNELGGEEKVEQTTISDTGIRYKMKYIKFMSPDKFIIYKATLDDDKTYYGLTQNRHIGSINESVFDAIERDINNNHQLKLELVTFDESQPWDFSDRPDNVYKAALVKSNLIEVMNDYKEQYGDYGVVTWNERVFKVTDIVRNKVTGKYSYFAQEKTDRAQKDAIVIFQSGEMIPVKSGELKQARELFKTGNYTYIVDNSYRSRTMTYSNRSVNAHLLPNQYPLKLNEFDKTIKTIISF